MPQEIHIVKRGEETWYRVWSTIVDAYVTDETNDLEALKEALLENALERTRKDFEVYWPRRIKDAHDWGSSGCYKRQTDEWDKSQEELLAAGEFDEEMDDG